MTRRLPLSLIVLLALCSSAFAQKVMVESTFKLTEFSRAEALPIIELGIKQLNYEHGTKFYLANDTSGAIVIRSTNLGNWLYGRAHVKGDPASPSKSWAWVLVNSKYFEADPWTAPMLQNLIKHELGHHAFGPSFEHTWFPTPKPGWVNPVPGPVPTPDPKPDPKPTPTPDADAALKARIIAQFRKEGVKGDLPMKEVNKALAYYKQHGEEATFGNRKTKKGGYIEKRAKQLK